MKRFWILSFFFCACVLSGVFGIGETVHAAAGINRQINYQGRLFDSTGVPVADGSYSIKFSIYNVESGGLLLWTASGTSFTPIGIPVTVTDGLFSLNLGDASAGQHAFGANLDWYQNELYLGVTVASDAEMTPRKRLTAVPYAFSAENIQGQYASSSVSIGGGTLFALRQNDSGIAIGNRTVLSLHTAGSSNPFDYLIRGSSGAGDVFSINRLGHTTTTGNLSVAGALSFGSASGSSLTVGGQSVCLANGTNCPSGSFSDFNWTYTGGASDFIRTATATTDLLLGGMTTGTAPVYFQLLGESDSSSRMILGQDENLSVLIGNTDPAGMNSLFQLSGNDLYVEGNVGSRGSMYTSGALVAGSSVAATTFGDGLISKANGELTIQTTGDNIVMQTFMGGNLLFDPFAGAGGTIIFGGSSVDGIQLNARFSSDVLPNLDDTRTLGSSFLRWRGLEAVTVTSTHGVFRDTASSTIPIVDINGGCDNGGSGGVLLRAGNTVDVSKFRVNCDGSVHTDGALGGPAMDFAEYITADPSVAVQDVVVLDLSTSTTAVRRGSVETRNQVIGVHSTKPAFIGGATDAALDGSAPVVPVALLGRVPTRADATAHPIAPGDYVMPGADGTAVKAQGPGMVIGRALSALGSGAGTIEVFVDPIWWGGDLLAADSSDSLLIQDLLVSSSIAASPSEPSIDSFGLTFQGSTWNANTNQSSTSRFTLLNDAIQSSSLFTVRGTSGYALLTISQQGDAAVFGDLSLDGKLFLASKTSQQASTSTYVFIDDTEAPTSTYIATNADGWMTASTYDYAERFPSKEQLRPGDLVVSNGTDVNFVARSSSPQQTVLGIVSTKPGFVTGGYAPGTYPVALAGRVPTRVSAAHGSIAIGDALAPSDIPGVAVKATGAGPVVGTALEGFGGVGEGLISVFVQPGWRWGEVQSSPDLSLMTYAPDPAPMSSPRSGLALIHAGAQQVQISFASLDAYPLVSVTPYGIPSSLWGITDVSQSGFIIQLASPTAQDLRFSWKAEPSKKGNVLSSSDGTAAEYDVLQGIVPQNEPQILPDLPSAPISSDPLMEESSESTSTVMVEMPSEPATE